MARVKEVRSRIVYVVPGAPHYLDENGIANRYDGRVLSAVESAIRRGAPVVVCGDANYGLDVAAHSSLAEEKDVSLVVRATNGREANTRGDMCAAAAAILYRSELRDVRVVVIVTCWYHIPRCMIALWQSLRDLPTMQVYVGRSDYDRIAIRFKPVWGKSAPNGLRNEIRGAWDYLRRNDPKTRGGHVGKPERNK